MVDFTSSFGHMGWKNQTNIKKEITKYTKSGVRKDKKKTRNIHLIERSVIPKSVQKKMNKKCQKIVRKRMKRIK